MPGDGWYLARYITEGVKTYLITATRGEYGWWGDEKNYPGPQALGQIREAELREAAQVPGIHTVTLLDYLDGDLDRGDTAEAIGQIAYHVRRIQPQVVVTFDCFGGTISMPVDGETRDWTPFSAWSITTRLDASVHAKLANFRSACEFYNIFKAGSYGNKK